MKEYIKKHIPVASKVYWIVYDWALSCLGRFAPKCLASFVYHRETGHKLNWEHPEDINQVIQVLKFSDYAKEWPLLADHYAVRYYVKDCGLQDILIPLYGTWKRAEDINFDSLPDSFVLKTNHGCGSAIFVKDKSSINKSEICIQLNRWMREKTGLVSAEYHYLKIEPVIMAVELLQNDNPKSTSIIDYKVWCFNGEPYCVMVCADRFSDSGVKFSFYDLNWTIIPDMPDGPHKGDRVVLDKPHCFDKMIDASRKLSKGQPQMRVDFYEVQGKLFFGELTMTSLGGYMNYISPKYLKIMGEQVIL